MENFFGYKNWFNGQEAFFVGGTIYTRLDPSTSRNIFTTAFLVLNLLIALVGEGFLKRRNQSRLTFRNGQRTKSVPFTLLTQWLSLSGVASYFWKTRRLPGGLISLLMVASGVFGLVQHYVVNSFILPHMMPTWCEFEVGIVTTANELKVMPSPSWPAALLVFQAHGAIVANGGERGVYDKINSNITSFQPTTTDLLGRWTCNSVADSVIHPTDWINATTVQSYLAAQNILLPATKSIGGFEDIKSGSYQGFLAWSGTLDSNSSSSWEVQTTIVNGLGGNSSVAVSNFKCSLVKDSATWKPTLMPTNETLATWVNIAFGFVSKVRVSHYGKQLETILNAMSMLAGSANQNNLLLPSGADHRYGCVTRGSKIYATVYVIMLLHFVTRLALVGADVYQLIRYRRNERHYEVEDIPTGLLSWQLNMIRRMAKDKKLTTKDLHKYSYVYSDDTRDFEFVETELTVCPLFCIRC